MKTSSLRLALPLFLMASASLWAHDRPSPTTPGTYKNWGGQIDQLEIVSSFKLADYDRIVVQPLDTSATPLPKEQESAYAPVKDALSHATPAIVGVLSEQLPKLPVTVEASGTASDSGALVIRGKVITMDPGVKAPVYSANGTGRARTVIAGEVIDGNTGKTLLRFRQERRFGPSGDMEDRAVVTTSGRRALADDGTGGRSVQVVQRRSSSTPSGDDSVKAMGFNLRQIGGDLADVLKSF
jgi:hypothetical protein